MFAAKPHEAESELPEGISEPRNVTKNCLASADDFATLIRQWRL
jgi:hypothetical protein